MHLSTQKEALASSTQVTCGLDSLAPCSSLNWNLHDNSIPQRSVGMLKFNKYHFQTPLILNVSIQKFSSSLQKNK